MKDSGEGLSISLDVVFEVFEDEDTVLNAPNIEEKKSSPAFSLDDGFDVFPLFEIGSGLVCE